jgi:hypothetical protein
MNLRQELQAAQLAALALFLSIICHSRLFVAGDQNADTSGGPVLGVLGPTYHHGSHHKVQFAFIYSHNVHTSCNFQTFTFHSRLHESFHLFIYVQKFSTFLATSIRKDGVPEAKAKWQRRYDWSRIILQGQ